MDAETMTERQTPAEAEDSIVMLQYEMTTIVREEVGFTEQFASQIAEALVRGLRRRLGAQYIYIAAPSKAERNAAIRREFDGTNRESICRKYGISRTRLYEIVGTSAK